MLSLVEAYKQAVHEAFMSSDDVITKVIQQRRVVAFYYMGDEENKPGWRTIEPVAFGRGIAKFPHTYSKKYIRAWQRKGKTLTPDNMPGWRLFRTDRIRNWNVGTEVFNTPPPQV